MLAPLIASGLMFLMASDPQRADADPRRSTNHETDVASKLRAEAARLNSSHASGFFQALIKDSGPDNREGLTKEMLELIRQTDLTARDALRFWLDRALAPGSQPRTPKEWEHLYEQWQHLKARVVGHAEALVLEGVLPPQEARRWRSRASRPAMSQLPGRYSIIAIDYPDAHFPTAYTRAEYYTTIDAERYGLRASALFGVLLGYSRPEQVAKPPAKQPYLAPGQNDRPSGQKRPSVLTPGQLELLGRIDLLTRRVRSYWWMRDIEKPPDPDRDPAGIRGLPPTKAMELRLSDRGRMFRESIVAHGEEIALEAILTPKEAEPVKLKLWRDRGVHALLDPELAARLHMTKRQREELADALKARIPLYHNLIRSSVPIYRRGAPRAERDAARQQSRDERAQRVAALDQPIWEILTDSQLRALAELLRQPVAGYDPANPKSKPRLRGRDG